jgi:hypothetical protein
LKFFSSQPRFLRSLLYCGCYTFPAMPRVLYFPCYAAALLTFPARPTGFRAQCRPDESQVDCSTTTLACGNPRIRDPDGAAPDSEHGSSCYPMQRPLWKPVHSRIRDSSGWFEVSKQVTDVLPYESAHEKHTHGFRNSGSSRHIKRPCLTARTPVFENGAGSISLGYKSPLLKHVHFRSCPSISLSRKIAVGSTCMSRS